MACVVKKGTCRYKILRALTILVRFKKKNGAYTENENIQKKLFFEGQSVQGWARGLQNISLLVQCVY